LPRDKGRVALIGAGAIARVHAEALATLPGVEVVALCDPITGRAESLARDFSIPRVESSLDALLSKDPPTRAHVLVPPPLHVEVAARLLEMGVAVLVEKPLATSEDDCRRLVDLASRSGAPLGVNHNALHDPTARRLLDLLASGDLGPVRHVSCVASIPLRQLDSGQIGHWMFREPGNLVLELMPHTFSLVHRILGITRDISCVTAGRRELASGAVLPVEWLVTQLCERGSAQIVFRPGGDIEEWWLSALCTDGSARADLVSGRLEVTRSGPGLPAVEDLRSHLRAGLGALSTGVGRFRGYAFSKVGLSSRRDAFFLGMRASIAAFHEALDDGAPPPSPGEEGLQVVETCHRVIRAATGIGAEKKSTTVPVAGTSISSVSSPGVLVTGAAGFLGGHLVERLTSRGVKVRALTRARSGLPLWLRQEGVELVHGDARDGDCLLAAARGIDTVVHLATSHGDGALPVEEAMVEGARQVARACVESGARLLFASTIAALYLGRRGEIITEETGPDPRPRGRGEYARAKIACEQTLADLAGKGLRLTLIRPGVVVGARGTPCHSGVGLWANATHCVGWSRGDVEIPLVLVDDAAEALALALGRNDLDGQTLHLVGDVRWTALRYVSELARATRRPVRFHPHGPLSLFLVDSMKWTVKRVGGNRASFPSLRDFRSRAFFATFDTTKTRKLLGWSPVSDETLFRERALLCHAEAEARQEP